MTNLETRVGDAIGIDTQIEESPWRQLLRLDRVDRDAFFELACGGAESDLALEGTADFARRVRAIVRTGWSLENDVGKGAVVRPLSGDPVPVPRDLVDAVWKFLLSIDGKGQAERSGKDYEGRVASEAEVRFRLGDPAEQIQDPRIKSRNGARPTVLLVDPADLAGLGTQPPYVAHGLWRCARKTVLAPTAVYRGLNRGESAPTRLKSGWALCGKPGGCVDNAGRVGPAPSGMIFMVFADADGYLFDWDWVAEDPHHPGHPLDSELRFGCPDPEPGEFVLDLPGPTPYVLFDASVAVHSHRGDCIYCYMSDAVSFAERINPDLTVFRAQEGGGVTGFKIKNVARVLANETDFVSDDSPDLRVSVQSILLATLKANQNTSVRIYNLIIEAFRKLPQPPDVQVSARERHLAPVEA